MSTPITLIAFGTFGNPHGFKQTIYIENSSWASGIKTFDLKTDAIKLVPDSTVYAIRKENITNHTIVSYMIYSYAKEQNSDRGGTFIGASLSFRDQIANENLSLQLLNEFHRDLVSKNVQDNVITVNHSNHFSVTMPKDFDKAAFQLQKIEPFPFTGTANKTLVVYSKTDSATLQQLFRQSLELLQVYDTIYFTSNEEIGQFVGRKGIFKIIQNIDGASEFEQELDNLRAEQQRKIETYINDLITEKQKLEEDRKKVLETYNQQIQQNEKLHLENGQRIKNSKTDLEKLGQTYTAFYKKIDDCIQQLKSEKKLETVKQLYRENQQQFKETANQYHQNNTITTLAKSTLHSDTRIGYFNQSVELFPQHQGKKTIYKECSCTLSTTLAVIGFLLWIGTLAYYLHFKDHSLFP